MTVRTQPIDTVAFKVNFVARKVNMGAILARYLHDGQRFTPTTKESAYP